MSDNNETLEALKTALQKAGKDGDDNDDDDEYDTKMQKYMVSDKGKMYMKKYMKDKGYVMGKATDLPDVDQFAAAAAAVDTEGADAVYVEGTGMIKAFTELANKQNEVIGDLSNQVSALTQNVAQGVELTKAAGGVQVGMAEYFQGKQKEVNLRKGVALGPDGNPEGIPEVLMKANTMGKRGLIQSLMQKAVEGDQTARRVITEIESVPNFGYLPQHSMAYIENHLAEKEV